MAEFKIAAAQVASIPGDLAGNIQTHAAAVASAAEQDVSVLMFPELSLVGYEPDLAAELAITAKDDRLRILVVMANHAASVGTYNSVGRSAVWAPDGTLLAEAAGTESCLVVASRTREGWRGDVMRL